MPEIKTRTIKANAIFDMSWSQWKGDFEEVTLSFPKGYIAALDYYIRKEFPGKSREEVFVRGVMLRNALLQQSGRTLLLVDSITKIDID